MLVALGDLSLEQTRATATTWDAVVWLLNYAAMHPNATSRYVASNMWLHIHSDVSYLSVPRARSRAGGHFILSTPSLDPAKAPIEAPPRNGPIHTICKIMKNVSGRSRNRRSLHQRPGSGANTHHACQNGPSATLHSHSS
jgi:hypothetical protein